MNQSSAAPIEAVRASFAQEQLWFLDQLSSGGSAYNIMLSWGLTGEVRADLLRESIAAVVARHDALRMTFHDGNGTPRVVAAEADSVHVGLPVIDLRSLDPTSRQQWLSDEVNRRQNQRFNLTVGPLFFFELIQLTEDEFFFLECFHHSILDGWSSSIVNDDLSRFYNAVVEGKQMLPQSSDPTYIDFITNQRARLTPNVLAEELSFWTERLKGLAPLQLPTERSRALSAASNDAVAQPGDTFVRAMDRTAYTAVKKSAAEGGTSTLAVIGAALSVVLSRYSTSTDIPIGIPMLGRIDAEWEGVVGMFINMTVLRSHPNPELTFAELREQVMESLFELMDHQEAPFSMVVEQVAPARAANQNPLFQVSLQVLDASSAGQTLTLTGVDVEFIPPRSDTSRFDVSLNLFDSGEDIQVSAEYSTHLFDEWRIMGLLGHLEEVIRQGATNPTMRLSSLAMVPTDEATELVAAGRGPRTSRINLDAALPDARDLPLAVVDAQGNLTPRGIPGEVVLGLSPWTDEVADQIATTGSVTCVPTRPTGLHAVWGRDMDLQPVTSGEPPHTAAVARTGPSEPESGIDSRAPRDSAVQEDVAQAFTDVLEVTHLGPDDNFFDAGGSSLRAMRVISRVNKKLGIKLSVRTMYADPTIRAVAAAATEALNASDRTASSVQ